MCIPSKYAFFETSAAETEICLQKLIVKDYVIKKIIKTNYWDDWKQIEFAVRIRFAANLIWLEDENLLID